MILVFAESEKGKLKKAAFEAVSYGHKAAQSLNGECTALVIGNADNIAELGGYGAKRVLHVTDDKLSDFDSGLYADVIAQARDKTGARVVVVSHNSTGKSLLGRLAVKMNAGAVSGVFSVPEMKDGSLHVSKNVFSGKAIAHYAVSTDVAVLSLMGNSMKAEETGGTAEIENMDVTLGDRKVEVIELQKQSGDRAPLPEAELVVSAGRGMKGPENWGIIEELADALGATTACSRPVADSGWRPHHEHVGQTGIAIKPNLYIAAGISGAIQHLAGVNSSKCIVVINKDPEAPFFKAADYGVCADLFDVVPRLTEAIKKAKSS